MRRRTLVRTRRPAALVVAAALTVSIAPLHAPASAGVPRSLRSAVPTVRRWLGHLEDGESRKAWRLMAEPTRRAIGGFQEFKNERSAWAEGWGAWASARNRDFELRVIAPMDEDAASVVTMTGRIAQEGPYRGAAAALPVHTVNGRTKVDPVHGNAGIAPRNPAEGEAVGRTPPLKALVDHIVARNTSVYFTVKGSRVAPRRADLERIGRRRFKATAKWPRRLHLGRHVLTIVALGRNDFQARAVRFRVRD